MQESVSFKGSNGWCCENVSSHFQTYKEPFVAGNCADGMTGTDSPTKKPDNEASTKRLQCLDSM